MSVASTVTMDDALTIVDYDDLDTIPDEEEFVWDGPDSVSEIGDDTDSDWSDISFDSQEGKPLDVT